MLSLKNKSNNKTDKEDMKEKIQLTGPKKEITIKKIIKKEISSFLPKVTEKRACRMICKENWENNLLTMTTAYIIKGNQNNSLTIETIEIEITTKKDKRMKNPKIKTHHCQRKTWWISSKKSCNKILLTH